MTSTLALVAVVAALLVGCGGDGTRSADTGETAATTTDTDLRETTEAEPETAETTPTETGAHKTETDTATATEAEADAGRELDAECTNPAGNYTIRYPEDWATNRGVAAPCSYLHPEPFELERGTEATGIAIHVRVEPVRFERIVGAVSESDRVLAREHVNIDGKRGVRIETESTGQALLPEGARSLMYFVRRDGDTFVASTSATADLDYERNKDLLDRMMETVRFSRGQAD